MNFSRFLPLTLLGIITLILGVGCKATTSTNSSTTPATTPTTTAPVIPVSTINCGGTTHVSGNLTYDFVSAATGKLDYASTVTKPMRNVSVELLDASNDAVICSTSSNDAGAYDFTIASNGNVKLRIFAEMSSPSVIVQDNTNSGAVYAIVTSAMSVTSNTTKDVRASSGWSGANATGSYTGTRYAAPFAILDSVYTITKKINSVRPSITYPQLKINWSINNIGVSGNAAIGEIITSHYDSSINQLFILGKADVDTDEYDNHIIVHEWGHFFESNLSRSDSYGGSHSSGDEKDMSMAFSEGWGNALSAMAFDPDVYYSDTGGVRQQSGFRMNLENSGLDSRPGWFSETSIQEILYDIYDSTNEANDTLATGIGPILDVQTGYQKTTPAATSIFSFIYGLKTANPSLASNLNTLVSSKTISVITDPYGSSEVNNGGASTNLPVYYNLTLGSSAVPLTLFGNFGGTDYYGLYNSLFNSKYLKFTATSSLSSLSITSSDTYQIDVHHTGVPFYTLYRPGSTTYAHNFATVAGQVYIVHIYTDQTSVSSTNKVNVTVTGSAL
jgi:hypothetical protein